ncbi:MAG: lactococcin 972 family bacteriocin [Chordicoccus sp.]
MFNFKRGISMLAVVGALVIGSVAPVYAANVGGGVWDYGTTIVSPTQKKVYSNYYHPTKKHKSSVSIGTTAATSGWVSKGQTSYASATGKLTAETHAYYDYK